MLQTGDGLVVVAEEAVDVAQFAVGRALGRGGLIRQSVRYHEALFIADLKRKNGCGLRKEANNQSTSIGDQRSTFQSQCATPMFAD